MNAYSGLVFTGALLLATPALAEQCKTAESVTNFGVWFTDGVRLSQALLDHLVIAQTPQLVASSMKLRIEVAAGNDRQWHLVVYDPDYRVLASFGPDDFADNEGRLNRARWTGRLYHDRVHVELVTAKPDSDIVLTIPGGIALPKESSGQHLFSTQSMQVAQWNDLHTINDTRPRKAGAKVAMLMTGQQTPDGSKSSWCCSAVMIGPNLALTNWHCGGDNQWMAAADYWQGSVCPNLTLDLAWDNGQVRRQYNCVAVEAQDRHLDYAVLRLQPVVGSGGMVGEPVYERLDAAPEAAIGNAFVIHHPMCKSKQLSSGCSIRSITQANWLGDGTKTDIAHDCDTEHGSSGAPVFNDKGQLVALHHVGFERDPQTCKAIDRVNKAVRIGEIITHIKASRPALASELKLL